MEDDTDILETSLEQIPGHTAAEKKILKTLKTVVIPSMSHEVHVEIPEAIRNVASIPSATYVHRTKEAALNAELRSCSKRDKRKGLRLQRMENLFQEQNKKQRHPPQPRRSLPLRRNNQPDTTATVSLPRFPLPEKGSQYTAVECVQLLQTIDRKQHSQVINKWVQTYQSRPTTYHALVNYAALGVVRNGVGIGNGENPGVEVNNAAQAEAPNRVATLSPTPRTLYVLWEEYQHGIGGRIAARLFSAAERGRVKHKYTRRKVVWDTIDRLVRGGLTANVAIDRIYQVYGHELTVTTIINRMLNDRRSNSIPALLG